MTFKDDAISIAAQVVADEPGWMFVPSRRVYKNVSLGFADLVINPGLTFSGADSVLLQPSVAVKNRKTAPIYRKIFVAAEYYTSWILMQSISQDYVSKWINYFTFADLPVLLRALLKDGSAVLYKYYDFASEEALLRSLPVLPAMPMEKPSVPPSWSEKMMIEQCIGHIAVGDFDFVRTFDRARFSIHTDKFDKVVASLPLFDRDRTTRRAAEKNWEAISTGITLAKAEAEAQVDDSFAGFPPLVEKAISWATAITDTYAIDHRIRAIEISEDTLKLSGAVQSAQFVLKAADGDYPAAATHLKHAVGRKLYGTEASLINCQRRRRFIVGNLDTVTHELLMAIATGQPSLCLPYFENIQRALAGGWGVFDGNRWLAFPLWYSSLGLSIIGDWLDRPFDLERHKLPTLPAWGRLASNWREPDPGKFLPVILEACDTHITRIGANRDWRARFFNDPLGALYPAEIFGTLALRTDIGLENPYIEHDLFKTPFAISFEDRVIERDELLDWYVEALRVGPMRKKLPPAPL
jgi:hypothetical protein